MTDTVRYDVADRVATVTLNRPARFNALTPEMAADYCDLLTKADADPGVRAIVVTGAGRGFCAGADLEFLQQGSDHLRAFAPGAAIRPELPARLGTPVLAAVNGAAAGLGFALLLGADIRIAAAGAKITSSFARLGLVAEYGASFLLPRLIGLPNALDLLLTGRVVTAEEALTLGLVQRVVPAERVLSAALDYARLLADTCSPRALRTIKAQVYGDLSNSTLADSVERSRELMLASFGWPDLTEGLAAQAEKRSPQFPDADPD